MSAGKGDTPRPINIRAYETNYERIWGRSTQELKGAEVSESGEICSGQKAMKHVEDNSSLEAQTLQT
jgi:hypothetical protein